MEQLKIFETKAPTIIVKNKDNANTITSFSFTNEDDSQTYSMHRVMDTDDHLKVYHNASDLVGIKSSLPGGTETTFYTNTTNTVLNNLSANYVFINDSGIYCIDIVNFKTIASLASATTSSSIDLLNFPGQDGYAEIKLKALYGTSHQSTSASIIVPFNGTGFTNNNNYNNVIKTADSDIDFNSLTLDASGNISITMHNSGLATINNIDIFVKIQILSQNNTFTKL